MEAQTTTQVESSQPILLDQKLEQSLDAVISATTVNDKKSGTRRAVRSICSLPK